MTSDLKRQAMDIINRRRNQEIFTARVNLDYVLSDKICHDLYYKIRSLELEVAKAELVGVDTKKIEKDIKSAKAELKKNINRMGYKVSDLVPQFSCPICQDTGYNGDERCECFNRELSNILLANCNISKQALLEVKPFEEVDYSIYKEEYRLNIMALYDLLKRYIDEFDNTKRLNITISGYTGVGKTNLCLTTMKYAISKGIYTVFTTAVDLNKAMLNYHCALIQDKEQYLAPYFDCDLLIIDDLGSEPKMKNVTKEYLYVILTNRVANGKHTLINTNYDPEYILDTYEERIFSRLNDKSNSIMLSMESNDLRLDRRIDKKKKS